MTSMWFVYASTMLLDFVLMNEPVSFFYQNVANKNGTYRLGAFISKSQYCTTCGRGSRTLPAGDETPDRINQSLPDAYPPTVKCV